jgi:glucose-6-phosphate isomerase
MRYEDPAWRGKMSVSLDYNNMMSETIGEKGIKDRDIEAMSSRIGGAARGMENKRNLMKWRGLPFGQDEAAEKIQKTAEDIRLKFDNFVVLGIGGSALGPIAVHQALNHLRYNELQKPDRKGPRFYVEDNIDPERMSSLLDIIDVEKTVFNVITKSGSTSETMAQFLVISALLKERLGDAFAEHVIATTDSKKGNLIKIAQNLGITTFFIPEGVGGRFSELSPVGLLSAAVCGVDIRELLAGAAYMDEICSEADCLKNPAYMLASLQVIAMQKGCNISVVMPYADSLKYMSDWYAQLWAESLGKKSDNNGIVVNSGQTPVKALGVTDQHSQVQLYTEGPFDKVVTFLKVERFRSEVKIPHGFGDIPDVSFLGGHSFNELIGAEQAATEYALCKSGHMNNTLILPEVNAFTIGQLLYLFEIETAFAGELLNINAFDQPGVEEGKNAAYALLGRPGYEAKKAELDSAPHKRERYII